MAPEIRFNSFGIPYIVEFANVRFRSRSSSRSRSASPSLSASHSANTYETGSTMLGTIATASSETLAYRDEGDSNSEGLFIRFASHQYRPYHKLSNTRILRLKQRIAKAVLAAGMDSSPTTEIGDPINLPTLSRLSCGSIQSTNSITEDDKGSLFRGTYGQVMAAMHAVGLVTTPCSELGADTATPLGALFVANHTECGIEFTKLTLWA